MRRGKNSNRGWFWPMIAVVALALVCTYVGGCASKPATIVAARPSVDCIIQEGRHLYEQGELDESECKLKEALAKETNNVAAVYYLSLVQEEQATRRRPAIFTYHHTVVTNHQSMPLERRTLEVFGTFDSSTTLEDVINRVGPPDISLDLSGVRFNHYAVGLEDHQALTIETSGPSFIVQVQHGTNILYQRSGSD